MKFERKSDVKETLKIGRFANAYKVSELMIHFSVQVYDRDRALLRRKAHYSVKGTELIPILRFLEREGLTYELHKIFLSKSIAMVQGAKDNHGNPVQWDKDSLDPEIDQIAFFTDERDDRGRILEPRTIVSLFDEDIVYMNKLYKIRKHPEWDNEPVV